MSTKQVSNSQSRKTHKGANKHSKTNGDSAHSRKQQRMIKKEAKRRNWKPRRRMFPIWLRIIVISILSCVALIGGLMVGYGILGDGDPLDALKIETWQHIIDIVKKTD